MLSHYLLDRDALGTQIVWLVCPDMVDKVEGGYLRLLRTRILTRICEGGLMPFTPLDLVSLDEWRARLHCLDHAQLERPKRRGLAELVTLYPINHGYSSAYHVCLEE